MPDTETKVVSNVARYLRPEKFDVEPTATEADLKWTHWKYTFNNFILEEIPNGTDSLKLKLLMNHLSAHIFPHVRDSSTYDDAVKVLDKMYLKPKNIILARHLLATRKQKPDESISDYGRSLRLLARDCNFEAVTATMHEDEAIRGAFISGILSLRIRERLLQERSLTLDKALDQALSLETAERDSRTMTSSGLNEINLNALPVTPLSKHRTKNLLTPRATSEVPTKWRCFYCGGNISHRRIKCPAFNAQCQLCSRKGHFANVCRSINATNNAVTAEESAVDSEDSANAISAASPSSLSKATIPVTLNNYHADALIDTGSSVSFIDEKIVRLMQLKQKPHKQTITLASLNNVSFVRSVCFATVTMNEYSHKHRPLLVVNNLCADVIIGHDILKEYSSLQFNLGGSKEPLICNVMQASVPPASIFSNLSPNIKPIAVKSRYYSERDEKFIAEEISKLIEDGVIEPSVSPWRAQVLVAGGGAHRKRLVIDYSLTINKFTELDAYPLPHIETIVSKVAKYNVFSQIDLKSAYHQVPIKESEKPYTAFEAAGKLYQFTRIPFGVTNGVAAFQRTLEFIIEKEKLKGTFTYLDDVTVCGKDKSDHDRNLLNFQAAAKKYNLTLNDQKCKFSQETISLLGYTIKNNTIEPDKERLQPLLQLPVPTNTAELKRALGLFAHYAKWVKDFSRKLQPLTNVGSFPLAGSAIIQFEQLKSDISKASLVAIDGDEILTVETDASEYAIAATLSQKGRPVAFFSRTLSNAERKHPSVEKEAYAIVESLRKWRHFLMGKHFMLITDQQSVCYMFNQNHSSKIKNEKILRWRLELSCYKYDIIYRPGTQNTAADALSRVCALMNGNKLYELHALLCHPGITRMYHWVRSKNLPYSINDIKTMTTACRVCAELKPRFMTTKGQLIKALAPFERLNLDFKGPLPSNTENKYLLTVIDEYSRFPWAYPCKDMSSATIIKCLRDIFSTFGQPLYIHSDRGSSFMSEELKTFLRANEIASSRTTPYNPRGNGQVERLNGTLWRAVQLSLRSNNMAVEYWERVLKNALHSIRSLLCTSINATPHERLFNYPRRSPNGESMPTWLAPGPVLVKNNVRSKNDPLVEEAELLDYNPYYSIIRRSNGTESTVSNRHLAPLPSDSHSSIDIHEESFEDATDFLTNPDSPVPDHPQQINLPTDTHGIREETSTVGRPKRNRRLPSHLHDFVVGEENIDGENDI